MLLTECGGGPTPAPDPGDFGTRTLPVGSGNLRIEERSNEGADNATSSNIFIAAQEKFDGLAGHTGGSRPVL